MMGFEATQPWPIPLCWSLYRSRQQTDPKIYKHDEINVINEITVDK